jgi:hypothetical protein
VPKAYYRIVKSTSVARAGQVATRGSTPHAPRRCSYHPHRRHVPPMHGRTATASHVAHRSATIYFRIPVPPGEQGKHSFQSLAS